MEVLILTTFVSLVLAASGAALFVWSARARTFDHADRLALLPLKGDTAAPSLNASSSVSDLGANRR